MEKVQLILQLLHPYTFIPTSMVIREMRVVNFDLFWTDLIQNVTTFYINNFFCWEIKLDQVWSILDRSDPKKNQKQNDHLHPFFLNVTTFYTNIFWYVEPLESFQFDQVWSSLIHFGQIWSKKIKNKMTIFFLFVNVATFITNIL